VYADALCALITVLNDDLSPWWMYTQDAIQPTAVDACAVNANMKGHISCRCSATHKLSCYGRPLCVNGRPCYNLPIFFIYLFFLCPLYSPALVNGSSRKFYTWWILSGIREVTTWIFSWSSLNYRVSQNVTKFSVFSDHTRKLSALTPERGRIL